MPKREEVTFPGPANPDKVFAGKHFIDERQDTQAYNGFRFEFCTFEKIGLKEAVFAHCEFRHCDFIDCYMVGATFEHCNFIGSFFDSCNFAWAKFPSTQLDYTRFANCAPVLEQIREQKPRDPQAAAKFFRNLAVEQKYLGNWQEVDRLIRQSYAERERHYRFAVTGANEHYRRRYGGRRRITYAFRYLFSKLNGLVWGYGVSWSLFARSVLAVGLIILPIVNAIIGSLPNKAAYFWTDSPVGDVARYVSLVYRMTLSVFLPFVPASFINASEYSLPFWLVVLESTMGTIFVALFVSLVFRAASKGV